MLAGSPPCQGFSSVGFRSKKTLLGYRPGEDDRNLLYETMVEAALVLKPRLFLLENVPGMKSAKGRTIPSSTRPRSCSKNAAATGPRSGVSTPRLSACRRIASGYFLVASRLKVMPVHQRRIIRIPAARSTIMTRFRPSD